MARSIHTTTRGLIDERRFACSDEVPDVTSITVLEWQDLQKRIYKLNAMLEREAQRLGALKYAKVLLTSAGPMRQTQKLRGPLSEQ